MSRSGQIMSLAIGPYPARESRPVRRRGFTLVELITVVTVGSILFSILTVLVIQVTRMEASTRSRIAESLAITRLSDQLREDVRAASDIELKVESDDSPAQLLVSLDDANSVHYSQADRGMDRIVRRGAETMARDRYRLPADVQVKWSEHQVGDARFLRADLVREPADRQLFSLVAQVGRYRAVPDATLRADSGQRPSGEDGGP